ncbi:odorant receptor 67b-like isoform X2 [Diachasmimorpha longicaudata]|uniref:odorant receptor 67b-like isoform X2 n=1 Tax=Diachasmimorpha longicaudata TaxID=58733 RepID=UPI0030B90AE1
MMSRRQIPSTNPENSIHNFKKLFNVCRIALRVSGIIGVDTIFSSSKQTITDFKGIYYIVAILPPILSTSCEVRSIIHFWHLDIYLALEICTVILSSLVVLTQGFFMYLSRQELLNLIDQVSDLWNKHLMINTEDHIVRKARGAQTLTKIYAVMVILLGSSFTLRPFFSLLIQFITKNENDTYDLSQTAYPAMYPFATDTVNKYLICITIELLLFVSVAAWWTGSDMVFLQMAIHLSLQYQILKKDLMEIVSQGPSHQNDSLSTQRLDSIGQRHDRLLQLSRQLKQIFSPILFCLMIVTGANICICVISLQKEILNNNTAGIIKCLVHTSLTMIQPAIYCKYANDLNESAELVANAAFQCNWVNESQSFKKHLQLMIFSAHRGIAFKIWGFFSVNLNQLTRIGSTAMSFFALVNSVS